ncbi:MAG: hypothetical protein Fur0021_24020 [Candidatus Promineifilaceae bacterium]
MKYERMPLLDYAYYAKYFVYRSGRDWLLAPPTLLRSRALSILAL